MSSSHESPKIDKRDFKALLEELKERGPYYLPGWGRGLAGMAESEKEPAYALAKIFCRLLETVIHQLNRAPGKHFIAFMESLGVKLLPPSPASAVLTFTLADGTIQHVRIPAKARAAAGEVIFETQQDMLATPAKIMALYSIVPQNKIYDQGDEIYDHIDAFRGLEKFMLFSGTGRQEHILYLGHDDLLNIRSEAKIILLNQPAASCLADEEIVLWQYYGDNEKKEEGWHALKSSVTDARLHLLKGNPGEIKEYEVDGMKSRWIRCKSLKLEKSGVIEINTAGAVDIKSVSIGDLPLDALDAVSKDLADKLSGCDIINVGMIPGEKKLEKKLKNCGLAGNKIKELAAKILDEVEKRKAGEALPDMVFYNDIPLNLTIDVENGGNEFKEPLYPFGKIPRTYDTFYIGSREAFSKKKSVITLRFNIKRDVVPQGVVAGKGEKVLDLDRIILSWEYWDGSGWKNLGDLEDNTNKFTLAGENEITFTCPGDLQPRPVAGQENHWVRVRIAAGDYGSERFRKDDEGNWKNYKNESHPPIIENLRITYAYSQKATDEGSPDQVSGAGNAYRPSSGDIGVGAADTTAPRNFHHILIYNNMQYEKIFARNTETNQRLKPFQPLEDEHQALYLGFDRKPEKGPVNLFIDLDEQAASAGKIVKLQWQYYSSEGRWKRLEYLDETRGLLRSGTMQFVFPGDLTGQRRFGKDLYWLRAVDMEDIFRAPQSILQIVILKQRFPFWPRQIGKNSKGLSLIERQIPVINLESGETREENLCPCKAVGTALEPGVQAQQEFSPGWEYAAGIEKAVLYPQIKGLYLNTVPALQAETIGNELPGSGKGTPGQQLTLARTPVLAAEIWVNEMRTLPENEKKQLRESSEYEIEEKPDETGEGLEFWVKWKETGTIYNSAPRDRHYQLDRVYGTVTFGDDINGKMLPIGINNVKAHYQAGGGSAGNLGAMEIKDLKTSIKFVEKVFNPLPADGGADAETIASALSRGTKSLKHRDRALTVDDFEQITLQASRALARAKCLPNFNCKGKYEPGCVTVIVIPRSTAKKPRLSLQLKRIVEKHLEKHAANTLVESNRFWVFEPVFVEVSIRATLIASTVDSIPEAEMQANARATRFLHPLTGGENGEGWEFGKLPCPIAFYSIFEKLEGVDHVHHLTMELKTYRGNDLLLRQQVTPGEQVNMAMPPYAVVYSGEHHITVTLQTLAGGE